MSKHTPGPWAVVGEGTIKSGDLSIGEAYIYDENDYDYNPKSDDVRKKLPWMANARLMAAAPEMLEILEAILGFDSKEKYRAKRRAHELIRELKTA